VQEFRNNLASGNPDPEAAMALLIERIEGGWMQGFYRDITATLIQDFQEKQKWSSSTLAAGDFIPPETMEPAPSASEFTARIPQHTRTDSVPQADSVSNPGNLPNQSSIDESEALDGGNLSAITSYTQQTPSHSSLYIQDNHSGPLEKESTIMKAPYSQGPPTDALTSFQHSLVTSYQQPYSNQGSARFALVQAPHPPQLYSHVSSPGSLEHPASTSFIAVSQAPQVQSVTPKMTRIDEPTVNNTQQFLAPSVTTSSNPFDPMLSSEMPEDLMDLNSDPWTFGYAGDRYE